MCCHNALRSKDEIHAGKDIGKIFRDNLEPEFSQNDISVSILRILKGRSCWRRTILTLKNFWRLVESKNVSFFAMLKLLKDN